MPCNPNNLMFLQNSPMSRAPVVSSFCSALTSIINIPKMKFEGFSWSSDFLKKMLPSCHFKKNPIFVLFSFIYPNSEFCLLIVSTPSWSADNVLQIKGQIYTVYGFEDEFPPRMFIVYNDVFPPTVQWGRLLNVSVFSPRNLKIRASILLRKIISEP